MKIAFIGAKELSVSGDREKQVRKLASRLALRGWEITLYISTSQKTWIITEDQGIRVVHVPDWKRYLPFLSQHFLISLHAVTQKYQVLHLSSTDSEKLADFFLKIFAPEVRLVTDNSFFLGVEPETEEAIQKLPLRSFGVWPKRYILAESVTCGDRNTRSLIKAFLGLEEQNKVPNNYKLVILGSRAALSECEPYLKLSDSKIRNILFVEEFFREKSPERAALFSQATLYACLSNAPSLPESLLEAMAYGVPPLVFRGRPMNTLVEKGCAIGVPARNLGSLKKEMAYYINRPKEAAALGQEAKKYIENYHSWEVLAERAADTYRHLLKMNSLKEYAASHK